MPYVILCCLICMISSLQASSSLCLYQPPGWWGGADVLVSWRSSRSYPPLATTGTTGVLGQADTVILWGNDSVAGGQAIGVQGELGMWLTRCFGGSLSVFSFGTDHIQDNWAGNNTDNPTLFRPYTNAVTNAQTALTVSNAATPWGSIEIDAINRIWGIDFSARYRKVKARHVSIDFLGGFLSTSLDDHITITTTQLSNERSDDCALTNTFYGGLAGVDLELCYAGVRLDVTAKAGIGNMVQTATLKGATYTGATYKEGGLLALPTNIGVHKNHTFEVGTIVDARLRASLKSHLHVTAGYKIWYFPKVALSGDTLSLNVNPTQLNGGTLVGTAQPQVGFDQSKFWAQAVSAGFYFVY